MFNTILLCSSIPLFVIKFNFVLKLQLTIHKSNIYLYSHQQKNKYYFEYYKYKFQSSIIFHEPNKNSYLMSYCNILSILMNKKCQLNNMR
jgi:hypothetical protein